jgi:hypothetical protein
MRFMFNLPPLPTTDVETIISETSGCQVNICHSCKSSKRLEATPGVFELDPTGDHASSGCPAGHGARYRSHNGISRILRKFAREAGLDAEIEPPTADLLLNHFSDNECRLMFPKQTDTKTKLLAAKAAELALDIKDDSDHDLAATKRQQLNALQRELSDKVQGRRIDVAMTNPSTGDCRWVDVSGVHPTSKTYRTATGRFVTRLLDADRAATDKGLPNKMTREPSPRVISASKDKHATYALLTSLADHQRQLNKRSGDHEFIPAVHTHEGELAPAFFNLIEWITGQYGLHTKTLGLTHGFATRHLTAIFRGRLKDAVFASIASGFGTMLGASGLPMPRRPRT